MSPADIEIEHGSKVTRNRNREVLQRSTATDVPRTMRAVTDVVRNRNRVREAV
jgi:hypothetical protein